MKIDQVAWYCHDEEATDQVKRLFGLSDKEWIKDTVTSRTIINGVESENVAELQFCYSLQMEFEILRYISGPHWHQNNPLNARSAFNRGIGFAAFMSHVGLHLDDGEEFPEMKGCKLVQENFTISHTSEYLTKPGSPGFGRLYHYKIFELSPGSYIKYIKRIYPQVKNV